MYYSKVFQIIEKTFKKENTLNINIEAVSSLDHSQDIGDKVASVLKFVRKFIQKLIGKSDFHLLYNGYLQHCDAIYRKKIIALKKSFEIYRLLAKNEMILYAIIETIKKNFAFMELLVNDHYKCGENKGEN